MHVHVLHTETYAYLCEHYYHIADPADWDCPYLCHLAFLSK